MLQHDMAGVVVGFFVAPFESFLNYLSAIVVLGPGHGAADVLRDRRAGFREGLHHAAILAAF
jgi:hypothetical protein